ncbi:condensation domain-containing protein [Streptomyces sp. NBC_01725]|uniref:condensation domain-containing protein n=1 Tax=Streptomyces sp. NBC_01725 TaxID=2975923 RepID=UPI002E2E26BF|nr:condensation domain-containing protein [Streptomyces sp. NBC_01725]
MTAHHFPHVPISVVVDPGRPPYPAPWDVELHGPLDAAALERLLGELTAEDAGRPAWRHRLLRHGPDHHTLRFSEPHGAPAAFIAGRVADRLTQPPPPADRPLTPAQRAALARPGDRRYEVLLLEPVPVPDTTALREALRNVVAAHPQLRSRLDATDGWRTARAADASAGGQDPLAEGEFTDEAGFAALLESAGGTLDAHTGTQLRAVLARDRRTAGPRADRLALVVHELAVDTASRRILLDDLTAALGTATGGPQPVRDDALTDWLTELRELAGDTAEARHWTQVARRRSRETARALPTGTPGQGDTSAADPASVRGDAYDAAPSSGRGDASGAAPVVARDDALGVAPSPAPGDAPSATPFPAPDERPGAAPVFASGDPSELAPLPTLGHRPGAAASSGRGDASGAAPVSEPGDTPRAVPDEVRRRAGFVLAEEITERITHGLARRLALTTGEVLIGVFALALGRRQGSGSVGFDVLGDPRAGRHGLRRHVGRLAEPYPVQLTLDTGLGPLGRLTALVDSLAACAGRADAGAGFGACREWSPDPETRRALRELPPAQTCLLLGDPPPGSAPPTHRVEVRAHVRDGRLYVDLNWTADPDEGVTDTSVHALARQLRKLLAELADTPAARVLPAFRATPQQAALHAGGDTRPGTGRHVEQLVWIWHGPLDTARFTASWQSVLDCETVLRTAFTDDDEPRLVVHERVTPDITRRTFRDGDWSALLEQDRLRGFQLRRPGALRLTLLEREPAPPEEPIWILVTYHRALLDSRSANILLREFYRAYLAGGTLPGGERRPDLRDYTTWAAAQDPRPAQDLWSGRTPPDGAASWPGRPAGPTGLTGTGHTRLRLDSDETTRLTRWAATWGIAESSVLQAVWALLIHWGSGATAAAPVRFTVTVSGRGVLFDGAALMPGPLRNPLPMHVDVDPAATLPDLLRQLRERALDLAAYEWVPGDWIHAWDGRGSRDTGCTDTVVVFEDSPHPVDGLEAELAVHGIKAEFPVTVPARCAPPVGLLAHHDSAGGLVLTGVYDRALFNADAAAELLAQSAMLLRTLSLSAGEHTTVGEVLGILEDSAVPHPGVGVAARRVGPLVTLRAAGHERAGTICLIPPPGAPATCYDLLSDLYPGPQELLVLRTGADGARDALASYAAGRSLLLGGYSGAGALACDLARHIAEDGGRPPRVVLADRARDEQERARDLARALRDAGVPEGPAPAARREAEADPVTEQQ